MHDTFTIGSSLQLSLLVKAFGVGDGSIILPRRVKAVYYNTNLTVMIPSGSVIRIKRGGKYKRRERKREGERKTMYSIMNNGLL